MKMTSTSKIYIALQGSITPETSATIVEDVLNNLKHCNILMSRCVLLEIVSLHLNLIGCLVLSDDEMMQNAEIILW